MAAPSVFRLLAASRCRAINHSWVQPVVRSRRRGLGYSVRRGVVGSWGRGYWKVASSLVKHSDVSHYRVADASCGRGAAPSGCRWLDASQRRVFAGSGRREIGVASGRNVYSS